MAKRSVTASAAARIQQAMAACLDAIRAGRAGRRVLRTLGMCQAPLRRAGERFEKNRFPGRGIARCWQPLTEPRLATAIAASIFSFAMLTQHAGTPVEQIHPAGSNRITLLDTAEGRLVQMKDGVLRYYKAVRLVYKLEHRLADLQREEAVEGQAQPAPQGLWTTYHCLLRPGRQVDSRSRLRRDCGRTAPD